MSNSDSDTIHGKKYNNTNITNMIMETSNNDDTKLKTDTQTDMMYQYFANDDKMVNQDNRQFFDKNKKEYTSYNKDHNNNNNSSDYYKNNDQYNKNGMHMSDLQQQYNAFNPTGGSYNTGYNAYNNSSYNDYSNSYTNTQSDTYVKEPSEDEIHLEKLDMLRKLGELTQRGVTLSQNYNMNSDLKSMKYEYNLHASIKAKQNTINWASSMMMNCVYGLEMMNDKYDPFSLKLKGWSEHMNKDINSYYDVFGELYEKYSQPGNPVAPEIKLLMMLSGSAIKFHLTNTMLNSLPNVMDKFKDNPELAEKLRQQALADKMKEMNEKEQENLQNYVNNQHDIAVQKADDIKMLSEKKQEFMRQQESLHNRQTINELQENLESQPRSIQQTRPSMTNMTPQMVHNMQQQQQQIKPVIVPSGMRVNQHKVTQPSVPHQPYNLMPQSTNLNQEEINRQRDVLKQRQVLQQQQLKNENNSLDDTQMSMHSRLEDLLNSNDTSDDSVSSMSTIDADNVSNNSKVILKRRSKKKNSSIKIDTNS